MLFRISTTIFSVLSSSLSSWCSSSFIVVVNSSSIGSLTVISYSVRSIFKLIFTICKAISSTNSSSSISTSSSYSTSSSSSLVFSINTIFVSLILSVISLISIFIIISWVSWSFAFRSYFIIVVSVFTKISWFFVSSIAIVISFVSLPASFLLRVIFLDFRFRNRCLVSNLSFIFLINFLCKSDL